MTNPSININLFEASAVLNSTALNSTSLTSTAITNATLKEVINTHQELMMLMHWYPVFIVIALVIYFFILTFLLIGIHQHHG